MRPSGSNASASSPSQDRRREAAALLLAYDARAGRPAAEVVPLARKALADGTILRADQPAVPYPVGAGLVPTSTVLAMADLDEVRAVCTRTRSPRPTGTARRSHSVR